MTSTPDYQPMPAAPVAATDETADRWAPHAITSLLSLFFVLYAALTFGLFETFSQLPAATDLRWGLAVFAAISFPVMYYITHSEPWLKNALWVRLVIVLTAPLSSVVYGLAGVGLLFWFLGYVIWTEHRAQRRS